MPSTRYKDPVPIPLKQPQTIKMPPPNFTVGTMHSSLYLSPDLLLTNTLLAGLKSLKELSSDHRTRLQSRTVQYLWGRAQSNLALRFFFDSQGFFTATHPLSPASFKRERTVLLVTLIPHSSCHTFLRSLEVSRRSFKDLRIKRRSCLCVVDFFLPLPGRSFTDPVLLCFLTMFDTVFLFIPSFLAISLTLFPLLCSNTTSSRRSSLNL